MSIPLDELVTHHLGLMEQNFEKPIFIFG